MIPKWFNPVLLFYDGFERDKFVRGDHHLMACNLPVLAWDPGIWGDPLRETLGLKDVLTSSVPYFSNDCGSTFRKPEDIQHVLPRFWARLATFTPRKYVRENLSLEESGRAYMNLYMEAFAGS